jgi:ADP-ribose pyrophosphatase YjhB (NUDIX family)
VGAVAVDDDRLLMIRRGRPPGAGRWSLPGGRVEGGETIAAALVRELWEETGLDGVCGPLIGWVERLGDDHHFVILDFEVVLLDPGAEPRAGDDADDVAWVPLHQIAERPVVEGLVEFLAQHRIIDTIV